MVLMKFRLKICYSELRVEWWLKGAGEGLGDEGLERVRNRLTAQKINNSL